jgi:hypothetical protein
MVYTQAGAFKANAVMPGNYELIVKARARVGSAADRREVDDI